MEGIYIPPLETQADILRTPILTPRPSSRIPPRTLLGNASILSYPTDESRNNSLEGVKASGLVSAWGKTSCLPQIDCPSEHISGIQI